MTDTFDKGDDRTIKAKLRLSFTDTLHIKGKAAKTEDAKEKYSCNLINEADQPDFAKNDKMIRAALAAAGLKSFKNENAFADIAEDNPKRVCYRAGKSFKNAETGKIYSGYEGNWAISAGTPGGGQKRPKLMDRNKRPLREQATQKQINDGFFFEESQIPDIFYGGCYADVIVSFYGTDKGGRGLFCTIEAIRARAEGENVGGGVSVDADDFDDLEEDGDGFETAAEKEVDLLG